MNEQRWGVFEFRTRRVVEYVATFHAGINRSIALYRKSGNRVSYYVAEVAS